MAPDSSLLRHHRGSVSNRGNLVLAGGALTFFSLLLFMFIAQAAAERIEFPGALAAVSPSSEGIKKEVQVLPVSLPSTGDALTGKPQVLWRNRIQIPINEPLIQKYIRSYRGEGRKTFSDALLRAEKCIPQMTEILESYGVPAELVAVVFVESRFLRHASYRGAGGYWQMLAPTARVLGLRVDRWVDERLDPIKSTKAAAKYLKHLHERYGSWPLALAAYNCGGRSISCAAQSGRVEEWELYGRNRLPARSKVYVSKVLAAMHVISGPEEYGFESPNYCKSKEFDPVLVRSAIKLDQVARWIDVPVSQLQDLNPSLRLDTMPPNSGYALRLPAGTREKFHLAYDEHSRR